MFFLLRCIFWLSIVYASIFGIDDWRQLPSKAEHTAAAAAVHYCADQAGDCISQAARLTALIQATTAGRETALDGPTIAPEPVRRPHLPETRAARRP